MGLASCQQGRPEDFFSWGRNFFPRENILSAQGKFLTAPPISAFYLGR